MALTPGETSAPRMYIAWPPQPDPIRCSFCNAEKPEGQKWLAASPTQDGKPDAAICPSCAKDAKALLMGSGH